MVLSLRDAFEQGEFVVTCELIPGRGAAEPSQQALMETAVRLAATGRVHAISLTDAPSGNPAISADVLAAELAAQGVETLVHFTCKDRNRNQVEAQLYGMQRTGIKNLLCMTGDYPTTGWMGRPKPVFDLDSVTLLECVQSFNGGMGYPNNKGEVVRTAPGDFFCGAVVSPAKYTEAEVLLQQYKLRKKVYAGARFIVTQVCFDAGKFQETLQLVRDADLRLANGKPVPLVANIFVLSAGTAKVMNAGLIPGCSVGDELLKTLQAERDSSTDKGKQARLVRAAKMVAVAKGLGYAGVHIGGFGISAETVETILDLACGFEDSWQEVAADLKDAPADSWWAYEPDSASGGNLLSRIPAARNETFAGKEILGNYGMSRRFHRLVFIPGKGVNGLFLKKERRLEARKGRLRKHGLEHLSKTCLYGCIDCGDCGLYATAYSCPMADCPKCQRNGACGGSVDGWCEVYPGQRRCVWFKAYHRLKPHGETETLGSYVVPPNNWSNFGKSPWGAMATGLDGYCRREWLPGAAPDKEATEGVPPADDAPRAW